MARHVSADKGVVYVAGGMQMARTVRNKLVEILGERVTGGKRKAAERLLKNDPTGYLSSGGVELSRWMQWCGGIVVGSVWLAIR